MYPPQENYVSSALPGREQRASILVGGKGRIYRSGNEFRLEGGWGMVRMVMRGGGGRWLETQGEEGGVMRASENASLDMESPQNVYQAPQVGYGAEKRRERDARLVWIQEAKATSLSPCH